MILDELDQESLPIIDMMPVMIFGVVPMILAFVGMTVFVLIACVMPYPWTFPGIAVWSGIFARLCYLSRDPNGLHQEWLWFFTEILNRGRPGDMPPPGRYDRGIPGAL